jgi:aconitase A
MGDGVAHLSMGARMAIANMTTEWGALAGVFSIRSSDGELFALARRRVHQ